MTQNQLDQLVANATGEDLYQIEARGFSLADPLDNEFDPEPYDVPPQVINWDHVDQSRNVALIEQPTFRRAIA
ncbi:MAG: hypothetical protein N2C12_09015 [Planctomycetales bacterium]